MREKYFYHLVHLKLDYFSCVFIELFKTIGEILQDKLQIFATFISACKGVLPLSLFSLSKPLPYSVRIVNC